MTTVMSFRPIANVDNKRKKWKIRTRIIWNPIEAAVSLDRVKADGKRKKEKKRNKYKKINRPTYKKTQKAKNEVRCVRYDN